MNRRICAIATLVGIMAAMPLLWGCGGDKKADKDAKKQVAVTRIAGSVDLFTGYGVALDREGLAEKIRGGAVVRLYKFTGNGTELKAVQDVVVKPVDMDGNFTIENVPVGRVNLVAALEEPGGGARLLSAVVPYVPAPGVLNFAITPETNLEAEVFVQTLKKLGEEKTKTAAEQIDSVFIKKVVSADLFFVNSGRSVSIDNYAAAMAPAVVAALKGYSEDISGSGRPVSDAAVQKVWADVREADMGRQLAGERSVFSAGDAATGNSASFLSDELKDAAANVPSPYSDMPKYGELTLARMRRVGKAISCVSEKPDKKCPAAAQRLPNEYGDILKEKIDEDNQAADIRERVAIFAGAESRESINLHAVATGTAAGAATAASTLSLKPTNSALDDLENLLALTGENTAPVRGLLDSAKTLSSGGGEARLAEAWDSLRTARNFALTGFIGMKYSDVESLEWELNDRAHLLSAAIADPWTPMRDVASERRKFFGLVDTILEPLRSRINGKYTKLPEADRARIYYSAKMMMLASSVKNVPAALFHGADDDGDGFANDAEVTLGSDPAKSDSRPAPVTEKSPESLLPELVADADKDGFPDAVEAMAGTGANDPGSRPDMMKLTFCEEKKAPCKGGGEKSADAGSVTLTGKVAFKDAAQEGVVVALYRRVAFRNEAPAFVSAAVTDAGGSFVIKAEKGDYFVSAFVDMNGDGKPGEKDAAGFYGGAYPQRLRLEGDYGLPNDVTLIGTVGGAVCGAGEVVDPLTKECAKGCPEGTSEDELTGSCKCERGKILSITTLTCEASCPAGTVAEPSGLRCGCPGGAIFDREAKTCVCGSGKTFDAAAGSCSCATGFLQPGGGSCSESCPTTWKGNAATHACECPAGTNKDDISGMCVCAGGGLYDAQADKCVSDCPKGFVKDAHGKACVCPKDEVPSAIEGGCKCDTGLERDAKTGKCEMPCPLGAERDDKGECKRVEDKDKKAI